MMLAEQIELACLMEATARKPGNVHPTASFDDLCYDDFALAARAIAEPLSRVREIGLGQAILDGVLATRKVIETNANLGIILLLAPLAAVPDGIPLQRGVQGVLSRTTVEDAELVYAAIRLAMPGGMGKSPTQDLNDKPTVTLREAMALAADRDAIAEQYATNFEFVFLAGSNLLGRWSEHQVRIKQSGRSAGELSMPVWEASIIDAFVGMIANRQDSLIVRKCGFEVAADASRRAVVVQEFGGVSSALGRAALSDLDTWLRNDGHRRNPGTSADLIAASLFAGIRGGSVEFPKITEVRSYAAGLRQRIDYESQKS